MSAIDLDNFFIECERCGAGAVIEFDGGYRGEDAGVLTITCQECANEQVEYVL